LKIAWIALLLGEGLKKLDQMVLYKEKNETSALDLFIYFLIFTDLYLIQFLKQPFVDFYPFLIVTFAFK